jgi:hypothetical protein
MKALTYMLFFMTICKIKYLVWLHNSLVLRRRYASQLCQNISSLWNTRRSSEDLHNTMPVLQASVIVVVPDSREPLIHVVITHVCYIHRIVICTSTGRTFVCSSVFLKRWTEITWQRLRIHLWGVLVFDRWRYSGFFGLWRLDLLWWPRVANFGTGRTY